MKIRKISYGVDFIHVLTFKDYYKEIIGPYFAYKNLSYGVDNENTIHESIRLTFKNECFILQFKKDGATFVYEGDIAGIKKSNPVTTIYLEIIDKLKKIPGFTKTPRHKVTIHAVDILKEDALKEVIEKNTYLYTPYKDVGEFASVIEFSTDGKKCRLQFGNYTEKDIVKYDLTPFKTEFNSDLNNKNIGLMAELTVAEEIESNSMTKLKELLDSTEKLLEKYVKKG